MESVLYLLLLASYPWPSSCLWLTADIRPKNYNNLRPPKYNGTDAVDVKLSVEIISILSVNEFEQVNHLMMTNLLTKSGLDSRSRWT